jgi:hypothetical protein
VETPDALLFYSCGIGLRFLASYLNLWAVASPWWFPTVGPGEDSWFGSEGVPPSQDDLRRFAAIASVTGARGPLMTPREAPKGGRNASGILGGSRFSQTSPYRIVRIKLRTTSRPL